ncbi:MAG TPA: Hsp20/alpha crystallin family protein [Chitinophagaceae bacterium]|nr:Hsp20/alpha crystallin family protein [Chitinophagaceae bacterium]
MTTTLSPKKREMSASLYTQGKTKDSAELMGLSAININEAEEEYILYATAAGLCREDLYVSVDKKIVTIIAAGSKEPYFKKKGGKDLSEQVRTFILPDDADPLLTAASYSNGSLEIHIPKGSNTEEKPLLIHVY